MFSKVYSLKKKCPNIVALLIIVYSHLAKECHEYYGIKNPIFNSIIIIKHVYHFKTRWYKNKVAVINFELLYFTRCLVLFFILALDPICISLFTM